jgi:hypothetical protein
VSALTVVVAIVTGVVLAIVASAHRTATTPDRYAERRATPFDAVVQTDRRRPVAAVGRVPGVETMVTASFVFGRFVPRGVAPTDDVVAFSGAPAAMNRALGADGPWVRATCRWQGLAVVIVPGALGAMLGLVVARALFTRIADSIGAVDDPAMSSTLVAVAAVAIIEAAALATTFAARRELHHTPAEALRSE